jgi:chitosanase
VIVDSFLHSGSMNPFLMKRFAESRPASGGNERTWIKCYLDERLAWFERAKGALHNTVYRPKFFLAQIRADNWEMFCPLIANGSNVC